jgi:UPF0755 protein
MIRRLYNPSIFILSFALVLAAHTLFLTKNYRNSNEDIIIKITRGENLRTVAAKLEQGNVIFNRTLFLIAGRIFGYQNNIIPGQYTISNGMTNLQILKLICDPTVVRTVTITIPEGMNIRQVGRLLQRQLGIDSARFVAEAKNDSLIKILGVQADNLEGFLFPDTYEISFGTGNNEREVVRTMFTEFRKHLTPEIIEEMNNQKLSLLELITMASIIEGETRFEPEKKTIAGVYYNRLKKHMKLEADPTVQYVLPDGPKRRLLFSDLKFPSPYNTYLNKGLPPGPINNPGWGSILAALYPENNNYLYFAAKGDGSHRFAETYDEHKKNAKLYRDYLDQLEKDRENK